MAVQARLKPPLQRAAGYYTPSLGLVLRSACRALSTTLLVYDPSLPDAAKWPPQDSLSESGKEKSPAHAVVGCETHALGVRPSSSKHSAAIMLARTVLSRAGSCCYCGYSGRLGASTTADGVLGAARRLAVTLAAAPPPPSSPPAFLLHAHGAACTLCIVLCCA